MSESAAARVPSNVRRWWRNASMAVNIALPNKLYAEVPRLGG
jgi:hypothetical protein